MLLICVGAEVQCRELYGRLEDAGSPNARRLICNSEQRVQQLLLSRGHIVRVWLDHRTQLRRFLIHYSGISRAYCAPFITDLIRNQLIRLRQMQEYD